MKQTLQRRGADGRQKRPQPARRQRAQLKSRRGLHVTNKLWAAIADVIRASGLAPRVLEPSAALGSAEAVIAHWEKTWTYTESNGAVPGNGADLLAGAPFAAQFKSQDGRVALGFSKLISPSGKSPESGSGEVKGVRLLLTADGTASKFLPDGKNTVGFDIATRSDGTIKVITPFLSKRLLDPVADAPLPSRDN